MCFVKPKNDWGLIWPNWEELFLDLNQIWKESPIEILRKTPKIPWKISDLTKDDIMEWVNRQIIKITSRRIDKWDKL